MNLSSEITGNFLLVGVISLLIITVISKFLNYWKLPPGPYGLPFVGYLPFLGKESHKDFSKLAKKYGKVFSVTLGTSNCVIINDYETTKQVLNNPVSFARPTEFGQILTGKAFPMLNGKQWLEQRRYSVTAMKDLGIGRGAWESLIHNACEELVEELKSWNGKPVDFSIALRFSTANNIVSMLIGKRLCNDRNSKNSKIIMDFAENLIPAFGSASFFLNFPYFILRIFKKLHIANVHRIFQWIEDFEGLIMREIKSRAKSSEDDKLTFIDLYLQEIKKDQGNKYDRHFSILHLLGDITALFLAAMDTTKASVQWLLLLAAAFPDVQKKIHQEIDEVSGSDRAIFWDDRHNFPYLQATINEMHRWVAVSPLFPPRKLTETLSVNDYVIPKGTWIIVNNWALLRDERYHKNPSDFKPERFLKNSGKQVDNKLDSYFPFSVGKRNCAGEHVAKMTVFLYFSAIMQKFKILCPEEKSVILEDSGPSAVRHAISQELCFIER